MTNPLVRRIPAGHVGVVDPPSVPCHEPHVCDQHGPTVRVEWTSGGADACPLCDCHAIALRWREALERIAGGRAGLHGGYGPNQLPCMDVARKALETM